MPLEGSPSSKPTPHETLGVEKGATQEEIRSAFRKKAMESHPDRPGGSTERFQEVKGAYDELTPEKPGVGHKSQSSSSAESSPATESRFNTGDATADTIAELLTRMREKFTKTENLNLGQDQTTGKIYLIEGSNPISKGYEGIQNRNGLIIGVDKGLEFLLNHKTGEEISSGFSHIELRGSQVIGINPGGEQIIGTANQQK